MTATPEQIDAYDALHDAVQAYIDSHAPIADQKVTDFVITGIARDSNGAGYARFFGMVNSIDGIPQSVIIELLCQGIMQFTNGDVQEFVS